MTATAPIRSALAGAGLAALAAAAVWAFGADRAPETAVLAGQPAACSGCDARHARLQDLRNDTQKEQE
jgi:hypothetical protein